MRLFGELGGPGVGDPDLEGTQSLITQSNSVFGDSLPHVTVGHERHVTCNWLVSARAAVAILDLSAPTSPQPAAAAEPTAAEVVAPPVASWLPVVEAGAERLAMQPRLFSRPPILTAVVARITSVVDVMLARLSALPAGLINEFLSGALLLVRRAL